MLFRVSETVNEGFHFFYLQPSLKFNLSFPKKLKLPFLMVLYFTRPQTHFSNGGDFPYLGTICLTAFGKYTLRTVSLIGNKAVL